MQNNEGKFERDFWGFLLTIFEYLGKKTVALR